MQCPKCGNEVLEGKKFCDECGVKIVIIYPERTCSHCKETWRPRKPNPKTCPNCGYRLSRDNAVRIEKADIYDYGVAKPGGYFSACSRCGKVTRWIALYRVMNAPKTERKDVCYICIMKEWVALIEKEPDMLQGTFSTTEEWYQKLDEQLRKQQ